MFLGLSNKKVAELSDQMESISLNENKVCFKSCADAVQFSSLKNRQNIFERELELCKLFEKYNEGNVRCIVKHKVTNEGIVIWVNFDRGSDWDIGSGRSLLKHLIKQFKLHLIGYDPLKIVTYPYNSHWEEKKKMVEYKIPLDLVKFDLRVFHYCPDYLNYQPPRYFYHKIF